VTSEVLYETRILDALHQEPRIVHLNSDAVATQKQEFLDNLNSGHPVLSWVRGHLWQIFSPSFILAVASLTIMQFGSIYWGIPAAIFGVAVFVCYFAVEVVIVWKRTLLRNYAGDIPPVAKKKASELSKRLSGVDFFIEHAGSDPYLLAVILDEEGRIEEEVFLHGWGNTPRNRRLRWVSLY
jgi:hypothetical protein